MSVAGISGFATVVATAIFLACASPASFAQNSTPAPPPSNQQNSGAAAQPSAGCTYQATSATATGGTGAGAPRHLDEGQTVTNYASRVTYVCRNGRLVRASP